MVGRASTFRVAIVHDWLVGLGGGERVVESLCRLFPQADIYTSVYESKQLPILQDRTIHTSFLQHWPLARKKHQLFAPIRPLAFESFDFSDYDLVISSSSAESKGIITSTETIHIAYIHTPVRYYWSNYNEYLAHPGFGPLDPLARLVLPAMVKKLRRWDFAAAQRPDRLIANSKTVAHRIKKYYKRDSVVINPPVSIDRWLDQESQRGDYYLVVSRLIPYKRVDLAIKACNELGKRLIVVGKGSEYKKLSKLAGPTVELIQFVSDSVVEKLYMGCRAFLFPGYEDFGITPVEAMAAGKPVICFARGGATETVIDNETGIYFEKQTTRSLVEAIRRFEKLSFNDSHIRNRAKEFSEEKFLNSIRGYVDEIIEQK